MLPARLHTRRCKPCECSRLCIHCAGIAGFLDELILPTPRAPQMVKLKLRAVWALLTIACRASCQTVAQSQAPAPSTSAQGVMPSNRDKPCLPLLLLQNPSIPLLLWMLLPSHAPAPSRQWAPSAFRVTQITQWRRCSRGSPRTSSPGRCRRPCSISLLLRRPGCSSLCDERPCRRRLPQPECGP